MLIRVVTRNERGYQIEADPRHAELIVEQVLEPGARTLSTPGVNPGNEDEEDQELEGENVMKFSSLAARCNYLSLDRPDLQYAVKEICREMAKPTKGSWTKLQRIAQFLKGETEASVESPMARPGPGLGRFRGCELGRMQDRSQEYIGRHGSLGEFGPQVLQ